MKQIFFALLVVAGASQAQVYKCPGPSGTVYSDAPCPTGQKMNDAKLRGSELGPAITTRQSSKREAPVAVQQEASTANASNCPSEHEIRNLETSLSSITMQHKSRTKEREFLQAEVRRARACRTEGGNYSAEDWRRIREGQAAQNRLDPKDRARERAATEAMHAPAVSQREHERMQTDKIVEAQREAAEQARKERERCLKVKSVADCR